MAQQPTRSIRFLLSLACTAGLLGLLLWRVEPGALLDPLGRLTAGTLLTGLLLSLLLNLVQAAQMLRRSVAVFGQDLGYGQAVMATLASLTPRLVLPGGLGVVVRILYLTRALGLDLARVTASIALGTWFKVGFFLLLALAGGALGADVPAAALSAAAAALAIFVAVTLAAPRGGLRLLDSLATRWQRLQPMRRLAAAMGAGARPGALLSTLGHALFSAGLEVLLFGLILAGLGSKSDPALVLAAFPLCILGGRIPLALFGLGAREALVLLLLSPLAPPASLLVASLVHSALVYLLPSLAAAPVTWHLVTRLMKGKAPRGAGDSPGE